MNGENPSRGGLSDGNKKPFEGLFCLIGIKNYFWFSGFLGGFLETKFYDLSGDSYLQARLDFLLVSAVIFSELS